MDAIIRILHRLHKTQESCFGSPIGVSIEASKGVYDAKVLTTSISSPNSTNTYIITSSMTSDAAFQVWRDIIKKINELRDKYIGNKIDLLTS